MKPSHPIVATAAVLVLSAVAIVGLGLAWRSFAKPPPRVTVHDLARADTSAVAAGNELVLFIVIDALRRDHLSAYGHPRPTSPTLDRLAGEGLWLRHLLAQASHTVPSTLSLISSRLPSEHGLQYDPRSKGFDREGGSIPRAPDSLVTMAELFAGEGFRTAGFVANPWLKPEYGFAQGYQRYVELESRDGAALSREARAFVDAHRGEKLFLYLHYMDVHNPYHGPSRRGEGLERPPTGRYRYRNGLVPDLSPEDLAYTRALYDERIRYMDGHLAEWLAFLREQHPERELSLVIGSDHGDEFYEHGGLGHGTSLYAEQVNSFAVLWGPRFPARTVRGCSAGIDVLPTLLDAYGIERPASLRGRSLYQPSGADERCEEPLLAELADRKAMWWRGRKAILDASNELRVYEVGAEGRIEGSPVDLPADERATLRTLLRERLAALPVDAGAQEPSRVPLDAETRARLEALGYLGELGDE